MGRKSALWATVDPYMYNYRHIALFLCLATRLLLPAFGQEALTMQATAGEASESGAERESGLFSSDALLDLTLTAPMKALLNDRSEEAEDRPATLTYLAEDGSEVTQEMKVKTRGNFRLNPSNCNFPPLRLNFGSKKSKGTVFEGQDKVKLVTPCQTKRKQYDQYVLQEYLAYKVFNTLTDASFRVRQVRITYADSEGKQKPLTKLAFLIEDEDEMATRLGGSILKLEGVHQELTDKGQSMLVSVYQYLIGNTDWAIPVLHNIKLVMPEGGTTPIPVPYDFDFAGVVDARYANPAAQLGISSVRERMYRGFCRPEEELTPVFKAFNEKKDEIFALYEEDPYLDKKERKSTLRYFEEFYDTINNKADRDWTFMRSCRTE